MERQVHKAITKIIDRTILEVFANNDNFKLCHLKRLIDLLEKLGVTQFEINLDILEKFKEYFTYDNLLIRIESANDIKKYVNLGARNFIFNSKLVRFLNDFELLNKANIRITIEYEIDKSEDISLIPANLNELIKNNVNFTGVRFLGLCRVIDPSWVEFVVQIRNEFKVEIDICPQNSFYNATAIAVEAYMHRFDYVTASFTGIGKKGFAPLEELLVSSLVLFEKDPNQKLEILPIVARYFSEITGLCIPKSKPVIGSNIFCCESGIHVSAISKNPLTYEPYDPRIVGQTRTTCIGKHTGTQSILNKAKELDFDISFLDIKLVLSKIREKSMELKGELDDSTIKEIFHACSKAGF